MTDDKNEPTVAKKSEEKVKVSKEEIKKTEEKIKESKEVIKESKEELEEKERKLKESKEVLEKTEEKIKESEEKLKEKKEEFKETTEAALHYMRTLVNVARECFLILDPSLRVVAANPIYYKAFSVTKEETEDVPFYKLGNGQWDIPLLKKLLGEILPKDKDVRNYEVKQGEKTILINAGRIDSVQLIILAMEDITEMKNLEGTLVEYTKSLEHKVAERTEQLGIRIKELEELNESMVGREVKMVELKKEIVELKKEIAELKKKQ